MSEVAPDNESKMSTVIAPIVTPIPENDERSGRKLPCEYENPIDDVALNISEVISPYFNKMNYTANGITTLSLIFAVVALYYLYHHNVLLFTIYFAISYLFDNTDGYYARRYGMVSENGDKYDHFKDLLIGLSLIYIAYSRYNITSHPVLLLVLCVLFVLGIMFMGCQEKLVSSANKSNTLSIFSIASPSETNCNSYVRFLRYFGPGTLVLVIILTMWYLAPGHFSDTKDIIIVPPITANGDGGIIDLNMRNMDPGSYYYNPRQQQDLMMFQQYHPSTSHRF